MGIAPGSPAEAGAVAQPEAGGRTDGDLDLPGKG